ncbi:uncharacterized protein LOC118433502 [Folsomia candida]|uniref:uncharacterized protein LOC118433502 n=1 Tax=Folsomia candida TaxID=158441 RepID=UPI001604BE95|nr:uncharacterized protein LOC118433502 [Folsomia candida]
MGSPISPIVAELFLQMLEMKIIHQNRDIRFWRRFVDDAFIIAKGRKLKSILDKLNNFNPAIEFTLEEEKNGKLAFLDTMLYDKIDGKIGHYVHRKPTHTNKYLDYQSFHPNAHKISVCDTLLRRAIILCDDDHVNEEIEFVTNTLKSNGYPNKMIQRRLQIVKEKISHPQEPSEIQKRVILPWAGKPTTRIAQFLRRKLSWEIGYYPGQKVSTLVRNMKQKTIPLNTGVYEFTCSNCPKKYIGESGRCIEKRFLEHQNDVRRLNIKSPIFLHTIENQHQIDATSLKMIMKEPRKYHRKFKEAILIRSSNNIMNSSKGMNVNPIWCATLVNFLKFGPVT